MKIWDNEGKNISGGVSFEIGVYKVRAASVTSPLEVKITVYTPRGGRGQFECMTSAMKFILDEVCVF